MWSRRYGSDVLADGQSGRSGRRRVQREVPKVEAERGLVVEDSEGRFCGAVVGYEKGAVTLEDRHGKRRVFPLAPAAFLLDGQPVTLVPPRGSGGRGLRARPVSGGSGGVVPRGKAVAGSDRFGVGGAAAQPREGGQGQPDLRGGQARR